MRKERFHGVVPDNAAGLVVTRLGFGRPACCSRSASVCERQDGSPIHQDLEPGRNNSWRSCQSQDNCAKLAAAPVWLTMSPGPVDPCPTDPADSHFSLGSHCPPAHDPVQFHDPLLNSGHFRLGENAQIHKWK